MHRHLSTANKSGIIASASILAAIAGYINVTVLGFVQVPVSHMSGAVSRLSVDLGTNQMADLLVILGIVLAFLLGAITTGVVIGNVSLRIGRRYGVVLMIEGVVLLLAAWMADLSHLRAAACMAALACGLQNAMASTVGSMVIRTTHVTGVVTDLGICIGHLIRRHRVNPWQMGLLIALVCAFCAGGVLAIPASAKFGVWALAVPTPICLIGGMMYFAWRIRHVRPMGIRP